MVDSVMSDTSLEYSKQQSAKSVLCAGTLQLPNIFAKKSLLGGLGADESG